MIIWREHYLSALSDALSALLNGYWLSMLTIVDLDLVLIVCLGCLLFQ